MASTTLPDLRLAISLGGAELVWINIGGVDYRTTTGAIAALAGGGGGGGGLLTVYVTATGVQLSTGVLYSVATNLGAFSGTLPPIATVLNGHFLEVQDVAYNAGTNNYTVNVFPGDGAVISALGSTSSSFALSLNDAIVRFTKAGSVWRAVPYGF